MTNPSQAQKLDVEGGQIAYEEAGEGVPIVLLHEGIADRRVWNREFPMLARSHRVVRYDARGFGRSTAATAPFAFTDDLATLIDHLKLDRPVLVGPSMGGRVVIDYALDHPTKTRGLFLLAPGLSGMQLEFDPEGKEAFDEDDRRSSEVSEAWKRGDKAAAFERLRALWCAALTGPELELFRTMVRENEAEVFESRSDRLDHLTGPPAAPRLGSLKVPTQVLVGDRDNPSSPRFAMYIAKNAPNAGLTRIVGADHLINLSQPREFDRELSGFLGRVERG
jgi:3-oxoadipate enol-lactonase